METVTIEIRKSATNKIRFEVLVFSNGMGSAGVYSTENEARIALGAVAKALRFMSMNVIVTPEVKE